MVACNTAIGDDLGDVIRQAREGRHLSIAAAADAAGINHVTWWRTEAGRSRPTLDTIQAIAAALGVPIDELVHDDEGTGPSRGSGKKRPERGR